MMEELIIQPEAPPADEELEIISQGTEQEEK